jgi:hypothetical protein
MTAHTSFFSRTLLGAASGALLLAVTTITPLAHAEGGIPGFGFAQRCDEQPAKLSKLETIACASDDLKTQEQSMLDLVQSVRDESTGTDGDTGERIDPMGKEQYQWRTALAGKCSDAACLSKAYKARTAQIQKKWAEALQ